MREFDQIIEEVENLKATAITESLKSGTEKSTNGIIAQKNDVEKQYLGNTIDPQLLPSPIKEYCLDVSKRLHLPFEVVATTAIAFLSNLISDKLTLVPMNDVSHLIVPNLWGCVIAEPGTRKTPLFRVFTTPIHTLHHIYKTHFDEEMERFEAKKAALSHKIRQLAKMEAEGDTERIEVLNREIADLSNELQYKPKSKYLILSDATKEKLTAIAEQNAQGFLIFQDEISKTLLNFEKDPEMRPLLLESWGGLGQHTVSRINRGDISIKKLTIGIFGGIQPKLYHKLVNGDEDNEASGFVDRLQLISIVDEIPYKISNEEMDIELYSQYEEIVTYLVDRRLENYTGAKRHPKREDVHYLTFCDEGKDRFKTFLEGLNNDLVAIYPKMRGFFSKADKLIGSLALLIYTIESYGRKGNGVIPLLVLNSAIEIGKYFIHQAIEARNIGTFIGAKEETQFEKERDRVLRYISKQSLPMKLRDVCRSLHLPCAVVKQILQPYYIVEQEGRKILIVSPKTT